MLASARELWAQGSHLLAVASGCEYIASAVAAGQLSGPQKHEADNTMEYWLRCLREDPFLTLSLSPDADETEFKKSYRRLALAYVSSAPPFVACRDCNRARSAAPGQKSAHDHAFSSDSSML